jgi:hypothetical protein
MKQNHGEAVARTGDFVSDAKERSVDEGGWHIAPIAWDFAELRRGDLAAVDAFDRMPS